MDSPFTGSIVLSDATYEEDYITELNVTKSVKQVLNAHKRYSDSSVNTLDTATHTFIQCMSAAWHYTKLTKTTVPLDVKRDWFSQYCEQA
jgi:hypothetical protein